MVCYLGSIAYWRPCRELCGAAIVETALVIPLLLLLIGIAVDGGRALTQYMRLVQVAHEGVRAASGRLNLEEGRFQDLELESAETPEHAIIQAKVRRLFSCQSLAVGGLSVVSALALGGTLDDPLPPDMVEIEISGELGTLMFPFIDIPLRASGRGPYLFERQSALP